MMNEFRPGSFQILPTIIKNLLIINVLFFFAQVTYDGVIGNDLEVKTGVLADTFALHSLYSPLFKPWQLVTHMFMHGSLTHIFFNMFSLWMFGSTLENVWGPKRFLMFYLVCGIGGALVHLGFLGIEYHSISSAFNAFANNTSESNFTKLMTHEAMAQVDNHFVYEITRNWPTDPLAAKSYALIVLEQVSPVMREIVNVPTLGASGAVFGCLAAFGYMYPNTYLYLYFIVPIKTKWAILAFIGFELVMVLRHSSGGVARWAHLGGALVGFLLAYFWNRTNRKTYY